MSFRQSKIIEHDVMTRQARASKGICAFMPWHECTHLKVCAETDRLCDTSLLCAQHQYVGNDEVINNKCSRYPLQNCLLWNERKLREMGGKLS